MVWPSPTGLRTEGPSYGPGGRWWGSMAEGLLGQPPSLLGTRESNRVGGPLESQGSLGGGPPLVWGKEPIQRGLLTGLATSGNLHNPAYMELGA